MKDKIQKHRSAYISKYGKEPVSIILGYGARDELARLMPHQTLEPGSLLFGMRLIIDNNKPSRVEVGDLRA